MNFSINIQLKILKNKYLPTIRKREEKTGGWYFFALTTEHMFAIIENIRTNVRLNVSVDYYGSSEMLYVFRIFEKKV